MFNVSIFNVMVLVLMDLVVPPVYDRAGVTITFSKKIINQWCLKTPEGRLKTLSVTLKVFVESSKVSINDLNEKKYLSSER